MWTILRPLQTLEFQEDASRKVLSITTQGMLLLSHAMDAAHVQLSHGNYFVFEHPASASSWKCKCVEDVQKCTSVQTITIDQCMLGLCTKVHLTHTEADTFDDKLTIGTRALFESHL